MRVGMARRRVTTGPRLSETGGKARSQGETIRTEKKNSSTGGLPPRKSGRQTRGNGVALLEDKTQGEMKGNNLTYYRLL